MMSGLRSSLRQPVKAESHPTLDDRAVSSVRSITHDHSLVSHNFRSNQTNPHQQKAQTVKASCIFLFPVLSMIYNIARSVLLDGRRVIPVKQAGKTR